MPSFSFMYVYEDGFGGLMCEIAIRSNAGQDSRRIILGANFLENYLQLYDIEANQMCLASHSNSQFDVVPDQLDKAKAWDTFILSTVGTLLLLIVVTLVASFTKRKSEFKT
jgi:hypothetical protein